MSEHIIQGLIHALSVFAADLLLPLMILGFVGVLILRALVFFTVKREDWFSREFEKRVLNYLEGENERPKESFFVVSKRLLERTYYELFEIRGIMRRRRLDYMTSPMDRLFLIQHGAACLVRDTLKELKFLRYEDKRPEFNQIAKATLRDNACFSKLFGIFNLGRLNDVLKVMPGLFVVFGIFGTFLGMMRALPELGGMDLKDPEATKLVMDTFLLKISFSMSTSTVGIGLSVLATIYNQILLPEKLFTDVTARFDRCLYRLWNCCAHNEIDANVKAFDEHRDPLEALAELAVQKELSVTTKATAKDLPRVGTIPTHPTLSDDKNRKAS